MKRRKDGLYQLTVTVGKDRQGNRIRKSVYGKTKKEVIQKAEELRDLAEKGISYSDMTVQEYGLVWLERDKAACSHSTIQGYRNIIKNHLGLIGSNRLQNVTRSMVIGQLRSLDGHADLQRRFKQTIKQIYLSAMDDGLISKNPCESLPRVKGYVSDQRAFTEAERSEIKRLINTIPIREHSLILALLFYTGIRRGELIALTWDDILSDKILINKSASFPHNQAVIGPTKTRNSIRAIEILPELAEYLQERGTGYVFGGAKPWSLFKFRKEWDKIRNIANISDKDRFTPHRFRHDFCSRLYESGISATDACRIMGHSSVNVTIDIYTHLSESEPVPMSVKMSVIKSPRH